MSRVPRTPIRYAGRAVLLAGIAVAVLPGCAWKGPTKTLSDGFSGFKQKIGLGGGDGEPQVPTRVVTSWSNTVLNRGGRAPQRGFGGRLSFFNDESEEPIRVDGQLVVYAFDETNRQLHETQPTRRFIFPAEQFAKHESASSLGPSYSFWLPWDGVGGEVKKISLIARFESVDGPVLLSEQTKHHLSGQGTQGGEKSFHGTQVRSSTVAPQLAGGVRQASATEELPPTPVAAEPKKKAMSVSTIQLPKKL
ncbi:MAG: hypothetical protein AAGA92_10640 [Planctomycetota bacterium]